MVAKQLCLTDDASIIVWPSSSGVGVWGIHRLPVFWTLSSCLRVSSDFSMVPCHLELLSADSITNCKINGKILLKENSFLFFHSFSYCFCGVRERNPYRKMHSHTHRCGLNRPCLVYDQPKTCETPTAFRPIKAASLSRPEVLVIILFYPWEPLWTFFKSPSNWADSIPSFVFLVIMCFWGTHF